MLKNNITWLIIFSILFAFTPFVFGAEDVSQDSYGAQMVEAGMKMFANSIGDSMISLGTGNSTVDRAETPGLIFKMITYTVDPYTFPWVKKWWNIMVVFYVFVVTVACIGGAALVLLHKMSPDTSYRIAWILEEDSASFYLHNWLSKMVLGLIFPVITLFGVYVILQVNYAVSGLITANALNAIPPTIDNLIAYLFMAIAYLILTIVFALRNIIIVLFAAGSLGIAALYLIPQLQDFVKSVLVYFIVVVFMQPALIFTAAVGTVFIQNLPPELNMFVSVSYVALIILLVVMGIVCIVGKSIINRIVGIGLWRIHT
ncbi:MAG TPA: hypothetical protein VN368_02190 [Candidatus Methylomirabilis sp.]|nr:hypothetical protein [Candidatus Methylomirabilis sp.]